MTHGDQNGEQTPRPSEGSASAPPSPGQDAPRSFASRDPAAGASFVWSVRVRPGHDGQAVAAARTNLFTICGQASFKDADPHPSAVEYLLGVLGGDLLCGFTAQAARRGVPLDALEVAVSGRLNNPLVHLGVVGEHGHPGFETISGTLYVSAEAAAPDLERLWQETLRRSPLVHTLERAVALTLAMQVMP
jgi:OsmC-like protein